MNDCNRDVHEPCSRSIQAARAAGNVDTDELMRRPEKASARSRDSLLVATPRRTASPPIRLKNRPPLASEIRQTTAACVRGSSFRISPYATFLLLFDFGKPSTLMSW